MGLPELQIPSNRSFMGSLWSAVASDHRHEVMCLSELRLFSEVTYLGVYWWHHARTHTGPSHQKMRLEWDCVVLHSHSLFTAYSGLLFSTVFPIHRGSRYDQNGQAALKKCWSTSDTTSCIEAFP